MSRVPLTVEDRRQWTIAAMVALAAHLGVAGLVLARSRPHQVPEPEQVLMVELPPDAAPAPAAAQAPAQPQPASQAQPHAALPATPTPPIDVPAVRVPLPINPVTLPPPQPARVAMPAAPAQPVASAVVPVAAISGAANSPVAGDPRARKAEVDYFSLVSAHLNRRKSYPAEAKKAREEGVVVIRFTVDRDGNVSGAGIKHGSGHERLDAATLQLLQRVAPMPRMPASMRRDSVTIALPIDYSLKTD